MGNKYIKAKIKNLQQTLEFQKYNVKEKKKEKKERKKKKSRKNYKENIGTKLITNTKKQMLKIQSLEFQKYNVKKRRRKRKREKTN